jgi:hypothetical protein
VVDPPLKDWIFSKPDVVSIEYHTPFPYVGDPFYLANVPEQDNRVFYNQIFGTPSVRFDGPHIPPLNVAGYEALYQERKALGSRALIELAGRYDPATRNGEVTAQVIAQGPIAGNWRLRIGLTESDIQYAAPNGINVHHHVFHRFVPDTTGTTLAFAAPYPDTARVTLPFALAASWAADHSALVAFLQEQGSREIEQAMSIQVAELPVAVGDDPAPPVVTADRLLPVIPNPFGPAAEVAFDLAHAGRARLTVHDVNGRRVRTLVDAELAGGRQRVRWDGRDDAGHEAPAGIYFFRLAGARGSDTQKAILLR